LGDAAAVVRIPEGPLAPAAERDDADLPPVMELLPVAEAAGAPVDQRRQPEDHRGARTGEQAQPSGPARPHADRRTTTQPRERSRRVPCYAGARPCSSPAKLPSAGSS